MTGSNRSYGIAIDGIACAAPHGALELRARIPIGNAELSRPRIRRVPAGRTIDRLHLVANLVGCVSLIIDGPGSSMVRMTAGCAIFRALPWCTVVISSAGCAALWLP